MTDTITIFATKRFHFTQKDEDGKPLDLGHQISNGLSKSPNIYQTTPNKVVDDAPAWIQGDNMFKLATTPYIDRETGQERVDLVVYEKRSVRGEPQAPGALAGSLIAVAPPEGKIISPQPKRRGRPPGSTNSTILNGQEENNTSENEESPASEPEVHT